MKYFGFTDVGKARKNNEDYHLHPGMLEVGVGADDLKQHGHLFVVCDGVGGHAAGEVASRAAAEYLMREWYSERHKDLEDGERLRMLVHEANEGILELIRQNPAYESMATTLVALQIRRDMGIVANLGDSRAYRFRAGKLNRISVDHSYARELYESGQILKREVDRHPLGYMITRAIGFEHDPDIDLFRFDLQAGDTYLLCSDGLTDMISDRMITTILASESSLEDKTKALVQKALDKGGKDNVTVILVE